MRIKKLIMTLVLTTCIIGGCLFSGIDATYAVKAESQMQLGVDITLDDLNKIPEEGKIIHQDENSITTIIPGTEENMIEFLMKERGITYKEAKEIYRQMREEEEKMSILRGPDEELRTVIVRESKPYIWGPIGLELKVSVQYVYNKAENKVVSIEKYLGSYVDTIGVGASFAYYDMTDGPVVNQTWYRIEVSYFGKPVIDVTLELAGSSTFPKYEFVEISGSVGGTMRLKAKEPVGIYLNATINNLLQKR